MSMFKNYNFFKSTYFAIHGLFIGVTSEVQPVFALIKFLIMVVLNIYTGNITYILFNFIAMLLIISSELVNSAVEDLCDLVEPNFNPKIAKIKDYTSGSVLAIEIAWWAGIAYQVFRIF